MPPRLKAWNEDLSLQLSENQRDACNWVAHTRSINIRLRLIQFKWLMQIYVAPADLSWYNGNIPDVYLKCIECRGILVHCMWYCRKIVLFWEGIRGVIGKNIF